MLFGCASIRPPPRIKNEIVPRTHSVPGTTIFGDFLKTFFRSLHKIFYTFKKVFQEGFWFYAINAFRLRFRGGIVFGSFSLLKKQ